MRIGSLCSGYGGLDLAVEHLWPGITVAWHAETDPWASKVLAHHWPGVPNVGDITTVDWAARTYERRTLWTPDPEPFDDIDVLTAGYPCQPFSHLGQRAGVDDDRHLWPDVARAVAELRPRVVLLENVPGHLSIGFDQVLADLDGLGYMGAWGMVSAASVGACHLRERLFVLAVDPCRPVAHPVCPRRQRCGTSTPAEVGDGSGAVAADGDRTWGPYWPAVERWGQTLGRSAPEPLDRRGRMNPRLVEWMMGLPDGWVTDLVHRYAFALRILGNGVVPQQAAAAFGELAASSIVWDSPLTVY